MWLTGGYGKSMNERTSPGTVDLVVPDQSLSPGLKATETHRIPDFNESKRPAIHPEIVGRTQTVSPGPSMQWYDGTAVR